jgi:hypothetical protein
VQNANNVALCSQLSHHLETLSATSVLIPALVNLAGDVLRVVLFPLTMLFGPFVNDFVASATRPDPNGVASKVIGEGCSHIKLELEADEVALRFVSLSMPTSPSPRTAPD